MNKYAIVMPAGSGKTTISKKYKNIYDIDQFHTKTDRIKLQELYKEVIISNDWNKYFLYELSLIKDKINNLESPFILLLHCKEKADLLNLIYLDSIKTDKETMNKVALERGKKKKLREDMTRNNWNSCKAKIFSSHQEIENYIIHLSKINNIKISKIKK